MLNIIGKIPRNVTVAVSGGADSMAVLDFLKNSHEVTVAYYHHGTEHGEEALDLVRKYCTLHELPHIIGKISRERKKEESQEEYWRNCRKDFFNNTLSGTVVTAHHLQDQIEWWIFTSLHGKPRLIPYSNQNVIRPFITTSKQELRKWCVRKDIPFLDDPSNVDRKYMRSIIRNDILPHCLLVNPGLEKTIRKLIAERQEKD